MWKKMSVMVALTIFAFAAIATPIDATTGLSVPANVLVTGETTPSKSTELTEVNFVANTIELTELTVEERRSMTTELVSNRAYSKPAAVNIFHVKNAALPEKVGWQKVNTYKF